MSFELFLHSVKQSDWICYVQVPDIEKTDADEEREWDDGGWCEGMKWGTDCEKIKQTSRKIAWKNK